MGPAALLGGVCGPLGGACGELGGAGATAGRGLRGAGRDSAADTQDVFVTRPCIRWPTSKGTAKTLMQIESVGGPSEARSAVLPPSA